MRGQLTQNGTNGLVYGGDENLIHIKDGQRRAAGAAIAKAIDKAMRDNADPARYTDADRADLALCPGCYMPVIFNAAVELAKANGQSLVELGETLGNAFIELAYGEGKDGIEAIEVLKAA